MSIRCINRWPIDGTEVVSSHKVRAVCCEGVEERVRTVMIAPIRGNAMTLHAVYSKRHQWHPLASKRSLTSPSPDARTRVSGKLSPACGVEPGVRAISWKLDPTKEEEQRCSPRQ
jgi:hypothetical protein